MNIMETRGLGKRYRRSWALRDCTLAVPAGHVAALVGPNGAGKTTLLHMAVGLTRPSTGQIRVLGDARPGSPAALGGIGFVAQDAPLYQNLSVTDALHLARNLNRSWDQPRAAARIADLGIPPGRKVGSLSGGQQAQLALTIALAKRPQLLILDEPMARLDPMARHDFLGVLMAAVAEGPWAWRPERSCTVRRGPWRSRWLAGSSCTASRRSPVRSQRAGSGHSSSLSSAGWWPSHCC